jgi:hypothetical protein
VRLFHSIYGTSVAAAPGDPVDAAIELPAGATYRVFASHGPEWSIASVVITPTAGETGTISLEIAHVVDTTGYLACEFHQHAVGSPDSPVPFKQRLASLLVEGIEFFASTDHDYLSDYDPLIDSLGLRGQIDGVVGIESTPFAYGHFIAFPLDVDVNDPSRGAVDWAGGMNGFAMLPSELWAGLRERGAKVVQVNHPRASSGFTGFQAFFDVAGLKFDFTEHTFIGAAEQQPVPADWLRLPDATKIFNDAFDTLEVWNSLTTRDTDGDGVPESYGLDLVLRDWMNFLSFGDLLTPMGNSDTHTREKDPAGLPRTLIRVSDDSAAGLMLGAEDDVYATILGDGKPKDVIVSNGPMLRVEVGGQPAIGSTVTPAGDGTVSFTVSAESAEWIEFDTIEVFANSTFDDPVGDEPTALQPIVCFTSKPVASLMPTDPCLNAAKGGAQVMTVQLVSVSGPDRKRTATVTFSLSAADIAARTGAVGTDAWVVVRVRGQRALYPVLLGQGDVTDANIDTLVSGSDVDIAAALDRHGVPAAAFTAPVLVDFDGGGWNAPFAP